MNQSVFQLYDELRLARGGLARVWLPITNGNVRDYEQFTLSWISQADQPQLLTVSPRDAVTNEELAAQLATDLKIDKNKLITLENGGRNIDWHGTSGLALTTIQSVVLPVATIAFAVNEVAQENTYRASVKLTTSQSTDEIISLQNLIGSIAVQLIFIYNSTQHVHLFVQLQVAGDASPVMRGPFPLPLPTHATKYNGTLVFKNKTDLNHFLDASIVPPLKALALHPTTRPIIETVRI